MILFPVKFTKIKHWSGLLILSWTLIGPTWAAGDKVKGEQLYQKCVSCHGKNGEGDKTQKSPRIAGQHDWYLVTATKDFKSGKRSNPSMLPFLKNLTDQDLEDLAAYLSQLK